MRNTLVFILFLVTSTSYAQNKKKLLPPPYPPSRHEELLEKKEHQCFFSNKYNVEQRRHIYPFSKATQVILVSFKEDNFSPLRNNVLVDSLVLERTVLRKIALDSLTSILYNVGYTPTKAKYHYTDHHACYEPRNGIVFMDTKGKVLEYIGVCFECHEVRASNEAMLLGEFCDTKYDLLSAFFIHNGIKYGAVTTND